MEQLSLFDSVNISESQEEKKEQPTPQPTTEKKSAGFSTRAMKYDRERGWQKLKFNKDITRTLKHGWLLPYLSAIDAELFNRWSYWAYLQQVPTPLAVKLVSRPLEDIKDDALEFVNQKPFPLIEFGKEKSVADWLYSLISKISIVGDDSGAWGSVEFFLDWCLFGFGHPHFTSLPEEGHYYQLATQMLYQCFDLFPLMAHPHDYMGEILALLQNPMTEASKKFYPTPMTVVQVMASLTCLHSDPIASFSECACGSGAIILGVSNYHLSGMFQDKSRLFVKATLFQCFLYAPWFAYPLWWLKSQSGMRVGNTISGKVDLDFHV